MGTERSYGVEIECGLPYQGRTHSDIDRRLPYGWDVRDDCSLEDNRAEGLEMVEVVSPVLGGKEGIAAIRAVCDALRLAGARVNRSCGLHVHVGFAGYTEPLVEKLDAVFTAYELAFFGQAGGGARRRLTSGNWCKPKGMQRDGDSRWDRYCALNLTRFMEYRQYCTDEPDTGRGRTFEVRAFGPTTNWKKIAGAVFLAVGIVEAVKANDFDGFALERHPDPRVAMADLAGRIADNDYLPEGVDEGTKAAVFAQMHTQASEAARVLRVA